MLLTWKPLEISTEQFQQAFLELAGAAGLNEAALRATLSQELPHATSRWSRRIQDQASICQQDLGLAAGSAAVITNGRVVPVGPGADEGIVAEDFRLMETWAKAHQLSTRVVEIIDGALVAARSPQLPGQPSRDTAEGLLDEADVLLSSDLSNLALAVSSILASQSLSPQVAARSLRLSQVLGQIDAPSSRFEVGAMNTASGSNSPTDLQLQITAVLNPLSSGAQRITPVLDFLRSTLRPNIQVLLAPQMDLSDLPLKTFYRYALPAFSEEGMPTLPEASFSALPPSKTLTLGMDVPKSWLVEPVAAVHDLDNIRLEDVGDPEGLRAEFELEALLLSGSCIDIAARRQDEVTPRGVQLQLVGGAGEVVGDTLVMSNLGYFQLKAYPGVFQLQLAPGRTRQLYTIQSSTGVTEDAQAQGEGGKGNIRTPVVLSGFQGKSMLLRVRKRPGQEDEDVLDEQAGGSVWKSMASWLGPKGEQKQKAPDRHETQLLPDDDPETIHIFTVASGHLYERLQKIMVLSALRQTKHRIKFWFIKNYMSPQMKRFLPHMAAKYGFLYEYVTYKWPDWLHRQTEKQRIIWAYKILFLDVLFPLSLRKVIFADADQIMRTDLAHLWHMDLQGAPYAYTPFCDNNKDMEGFRFWKQGFWKDHLRGRPYHISALYVVDLARFRQMAAGDQLRVIYDQLSKDPNSLSNLDQDLPNYAQHSVPIFSLPQEWLWCETWCGNATKPGAKTIDLCNNPLTKEPKLAQARRIVPEWTALDEEVRQYTQQVEESFAAQDAAVPVSPTMLQGLSSKSEPVASSQEPPCSSQPDAACLQVGPGLPKDQQHDPAEL